MVGKDVINRSNGTTTAVTNSSTSSSRNSNSISFGHPIVVVVDRKKDNNNNNNDVTVGAIRTTTTNVDVSPSNTTTTSTVKRKRPNRTNQYNNNNNSNNDDPNNNNNNNKNTNNKNNNNYYRRSSSNPTSNNSHYNHHNIANIFLGLLLVIAATSCYRSSYHVDVMMVTTVVTSSKQQQEQQQQQQYPVVDNGDGTTMTTRTSSAIHASLKDFQQSGRQQRQQQNQQRPPPLSSSSMLRKVSEQQQTVKDETTTTTTMNKDQQKEPSSSSSTSSLTQQQQQQNRQQHNNNDLPDGNMTFSACLLVMDDNPKLPEWLAYHYHVLPLRYLIVAVDPRSIYSPTHILDQWRSLVDDDNGPMIIEEWSDIDFLRPDLAVNVIPDDASLQIKRDRHRIRQKTFYRVCLEKLRDLNRTWTLLIDTDEYLMYNHKSSSSSSGSYNNSNNNDPIYMEWEQQQQRRHVERDKYPNTKHRVPLSGPPPSPYIAGAMIHYIHREQQAGHIFFQSPCISCPRLQFGAKESISQQKNKNVPTDLLLGDNFDVPPSDRLDTVRYRHHSERQDFVKNGLSKSIIDVSRLLPKTSAIPRIETLHRPIKTICPPPWRDEWEAGLRIYHYLGSWEAYSYRDDSRRGGERSYEGWAFKAKDADENDDNIRPWLSGFVQHHGIHRAQSLLQHAGLPSDYGGPVHNWTIQFLNEILSVNVTTGNDSRKAFDNFVRDFHFVKNQSLEGII